MSLSDFWDNITTPGFLENALEEFREINRETKEEFREIFQDGQELVTDAFQHCIIEQKGEYTFTSEQRRSAREAMDQSHENLLSARGVDENSQFLFDYFEIYFKKPLQELREIPPELLDAITKETQEKLYPIPVTSIHQLEELQAQLLQHLQLPKSPQYKIPVDEQFNAEIGALFGKATDRAKRHQSTDAFTEAVTQYCKQVADHIEELKKAGMPFCLERLNEQQQENLKNLCHSLTWHFLQPSEFIGLALFAHLTGNGTAASVQEEKDNIYKGKIRTALERLSCVYALVTVALNPEETEQAISASGQQVIDQIVLEIPSKEDESDEDESKIGD